MTNAITASDSPQRGHVVMSGSQTRRRSAAQSSRRASVIADGKELVVGKFGALVLVDDATTIDGHIVIDDVWIWAR